MATVRNTTPSDRSIGVHLVPAGGSAPVPDEAIEKFKGRGPGIRRLFTDGFLVVEEEAKASKPAKSSKKGKQ